jgi:hypothetical protein
VRATTDQKNGNQDFYSLFYSDGQRKGIERHFMALFYSCDKETTRVENVNIHWLPESDAIVRYLLQNYG